MKKRYFGSLVLVISLVGLLLSSGCPKIGETRKPLFECDKLSARLLSQTPDRSSPKGLSDYYDILIHLSIAELKSKLVELEFCSKRLDEKFKAGEIPDDYYKDVSLQYEVEITLIKLALEYLSTVKSPAEGEEQ